MKRKITPYLLLAPMLCLMLLFLAGLVNSVVQSFGYIPAFDMTKPTLKYYREILQSDTLLSSISLSLYIALVSSVLAVLLGTLLCWCLVVTNKAKGKAMQAIKLPILVPHTVVAILIINMCSQTGLLARICFALGLEGAVGWFDQLLFTKNSFGVILAYLWKEVPFICYFVISIMGSIQGTLGQAALNLGAGKWKTFTNVTLPLCMPSVKNAFLIVFSFSFGAYELPLLLGSTLPKALPVQAYVEYTHPDLTHRPIAMALNTIMLVICLATAVLYYRLLQDKTNRPQKKQPRQEAPL